LRSTETPGVKAWGLNVVLVVIWSPPWGGHPIALPINLRIHRKGGPTPRQLVVAMILEVAILALTNVLYYVDLES
jgi:hypothetical protein